MIDVDDFKKINDTRGHAAGDAALVTIAHILKTHTRDIDIPARFAGDEFSLIMPRTDARTAPPVLDRIVAELRRHGLPASIGVGFAGRDTDAAEVMRRADEAVYAAKAAGKGCWRLAR
jgi:diguanylate cyclase (GGDEF)-like protein